MRGKRCGALFFVVDKCAAIRTTARLGGGVLAVNREPWHSEVLESHKQGVLFRTQININVKLIFIK